MALFDLVAPKGAVFNDPQCIVESSSCVYFRQELQGTGATRSSVPCLQNCRISRKRYCFRSSLNPSGLISDGSADSGGKIVRFFKSIKDCSGELLNSLK